MKIKALLVLLLLTFLSCPKHQTNNLPQFICIWKEINSKDFQKKVCKYKKRDKNCAYTQCEAINYIESVYGKVSKSFKNKYCK
jgi:hypothetical protein